jgi:prepilin-type N-terminal cleavage/methylation domain-containing protein/prepilin-type processing-associated H-X9-DG protein
MPAPASHGVSTMPARAFNCARRDRAFTLIELLVVIAIISLLISVLLPVLSKSRQVGRATACLANMHSLAQSVQMYADSNDGRLPAVGLAHGGSVDEDNAWINSAANEIGNEKVTRCPADESRYWNSYLGATGQKRRLSYATNYYTVGTLEGFEEFNSYTRITRPSTTIFWVELTEEGDFAVADHVHPETWFTNPLTLVQREIQIKRHLSRANYGFVDGHAEPQRFEDTYGIDLAQSAFPNIAWIHNKFNPKCGW